jgi:hypothetical protein
MIQSSIYQLDIIQRLLNALARKRIIAGSSQKLPEQCPLAFNCASVCQLRSDIRARRHSTVTAVQFVRLEI